MEKTKNEKELLERIKKDIKESGKEKVVLFAGHFPLTYKEEGNEVNKWGLFSKYTLELGCKAGEYARSIGKKVEFLILADDHTYQSDSSTNKEKKIRKRFYKKHSGPNAKLPKEFQEIMEKHGFDETSVLRQDQGKKGRRDSIIFSELSLINSGVVFIKNSCARGYASFIENPKYYDKENSHLVSFVPDKCSSNVCEHALENNIKNLSASHVFMHTDIDLLDLTDVETLYKKWGVYYRRDSP